ncbi:AzlC family ABC transporter permease [Dehalogenimonas alkenigignens]|uniref:Putative branched-chain amino acid permease (Azaleucine resistance) n=1 Tax=Dehalogenimonas alkenigignens TaxID=1217799 RepID=A0A0W0GI94_9CHLR|nr:AzlC family ABC transporter permease [Dehalogenimonas alkenigignens]KTB48241.1 putative branched-chain amino acid permease (azaleucine resistance) [Dehalogenimonas alkenigignens]PVV84476.1 branched-chain amino acid ABC transporter permease [Dehalogenimonas alkenigignens]
MTRDIRQGIKAALPVVLGYLPVGIAYGVLARAAGLSALETGAMSFFVFAGASQFIAVGMLASGAGVLPIILTTFAVNLRHLLMSSAIAPFFKGQSMNKLVLLSAFLTDESFAVAMHDTSKIAGRPTYLIALQATAYTAWLSGSVIGAVFGSLIDSASFGIPFAMTALFICLLVLQLKSRAHLAVALAAGGLALVFKGFMPNNLFILAAAAAAPLAGLWLSPRQPAPIEAEVKTDAA